MKEHLHNSSRELLDNVHCSILVILQCYDVSKGLNKNYTQKISFKRLWRPHQQKVMRGFLGLQKRLLKGRGKNRYIYIGNYLKDVSVDIRTLFAMLFS